MTRTVTDPDAERLYDTIMAEARVNGWGAPHLIGFLLSLAATLALGIGLPFRDFTTAAGRAFRQVRTGRSA